MGRSDPSSSTNPSSASHPMPLPSSYQLDEQEEDETLLKQNIGCGVHKRKRTDEDRETEAEEAEFQNNKKALCDRYCFGTSTRRVSDHPESKSTELKEIKAKGATNDLSDLSWNSEHQNCKKLVIESMSSLASNLSEIMCGLTDSSSGKDLISKILLSCSEEILRVNQSHASYSMENVISEVSGVMIKHFTALLRFFERRIKRLEGENKELGWEIEAARMLGNCCCQFSLCKCNCHKPGADRAPQERL